VLAALAGKPGEGELTIIVYAQAATAKPENYWWKALIRSVRYSLC
jgi:hypothetical protein